MNYPYGLHNILNPQEELCSSLPCSYSVSLLLTDGLPCLLCGAIVAVNMLCLILALCLFHMDLRCLSWFPVTPYIKLFILWRATLLNLFRGGIDWRGTFYPLDELKRHKVSVLPWVRMKDREDELP